MKICPACNQTYDDNQNYCLNDGATLIDSQDDAPPTLMMDRARTTQPNWQNIQSEASRQNQPPQTTQYAPLQQNQPFYPAQHQIPNQTLPTISLVLGIFGVLFTCCYGGIPLGAAAVVTGYIGLKNHNENPQAYGGRGLAIAGMITGAVGLLFSAGIILIAIIANL